MLNLNFLKTIFCTTKVEIFKYDDWGRPVYNQKYRTVKELLKDNSMIFDGIFDSADRIEYFDEFIEDNKNLSFKEVIDNLRYKTNFWRFKIGQ